MKLYTFCAFLVAAALASPTIRAQKIKITDGSLSPLKNEKTLNTEFTYGDMKVGKFDKEADYIASKKEEYNKKEAGKGDAWAKSWVADRESRYEPKFNELFEKHSEMNVKKDAKYTMIVHTVFTEPGFNVGVWKKNAEINMEVEVVESTNKNHSIAKIEVQKVPGRSFWGADFDTGERIAECYAVAGKALGNLVSKSK